MKIVNSNFDECRPFFLQDDDKAVHQPSFGADEFLMITTVSDCKFWIIFIKYTMACNVCLEKNEYETK